MTRRLVAPLVFGLALAIASPAAASLTTFTQFVGNYGVSTDGFGSTTNTGTIQASVPVGATVVGAYLYTSTFQTGLSGISVTLNGNAVALTNLGTNNSLTAGRGDVTAIVQGVANGGSAVPFNFTVTEGSSNQDGEALVVVYQLAALPTTTIGILDGFSQSSGDSASISFLNPLASSDPGFFAEMFIGDGFSFDGSDPANPGSTSQTSTISVNGTVMTNVAGHCDDSADSFCANGNLITVGSFNDPVTPQNPTVGQDHERYNLVPFIPNNSTSILINTLNPSHDDNIFLEVFRVLGQGSVTAGPPTGVPEPGTLTLVGLGAAAVVRRLRRR